MQDQNSWVRFEIQNIVWTIKPCAQIHDAGYFLIKDDMGTLLYVNEHMVKAVSWQEDPAIQNEHIKMSGELSIFYPNWKEEMTTPANATIADVQKEIGKHLERLNG